MHWTLRCPLCITPLVYTVHVCFLLLKLHYRWQRSSSSLLSVAVRGADPESSCHRRLHSIIKPHSSKESQSCSAARQLLRETPHWASPAALRLIKSCQDSFCSRLNSFIWVRLSPEHSFTPVATVSISNPLFNLTTTVNLAFLFFFFLFVSPHHPLTLNFIQFICLPKGALGI